LTHYAVSKSPRHPRTIEGVAGVDERSVSDTALFPRVWNNVPQHACRGQWSIRRSVWGGDSTRAHVSAPLLVAVEPGAPVELEGGVL
jgi:hypothetical protein